MTLHSLAELPRPQVPTSVADLAHYVRKSPVDMKRVLCERATKAFIDAEQALLVLSGLWCSGTGEWKHGNNAALWQECADYVDEHMELPVIAQVKLLGCTVEKLVMNGGIVP